MPLTLRSPLGVCLLLFSSAFGEAAPAAATNAVAPAAVVPVADFFRPPALMLPLVNRSGDKIVARFETEDDHVGAIFFDLKTGKANGFRLGQDRDVYELNWLDDRHVLTSQSKERLWADGLFVVEPRDVRSQMAIERDSAVRFVSVPESTPMQPIVWIQQDAYQDGKDIGAVRLDATKSVDANKYADPIQRPNEDVNSELERNGTMASIIENYPTMPTRTEDYIADRHGELAFALGMNNGVEKLYYLDGRKWVQSPLDMDDFDLAGAGDIDGEVIAVGPRQDKKPRELVRVDARTGKVTGTLYSDDAYDPQVERLIRDPKSGQIIGLQLYRQSLQTIWLDEDHKAIQRVMAKIFPHEMIYYIGNDTEQKHFVFAVFSDRHPAAYYAFDLDKKEVALIAETEPWLKNVPLAPMQEIHYKTRDGFQVEGFVTLPRGTSPAHPPPLVVLVHGGPWARDYWDFDPEVQFLASRGYAVFQPNYRGSTGYGWRFPAGDGWEFMKMHYDVTDGVRKLAKSGLIDPHRIAIMGASFGGYLAMCGAAYEPTLYRCAITEAGVFDWTMLMNQARRDRFESLRYQLFTRFLGDPQKNAQWYSAISPLNHIDQVKVPVFVAHGRDDSVVEIEQSKRLVTELEKHHVVYKTLFKSGEGHGMSRLKNQVAYYSAVEQFLAENMQ